MDEFTDLVGRLAKLQDIVSKPELNGVYVSLLAYHPEKQRFSVISLPPPNAPGHAVKILVKRSSFTLCCPDRFSEKYPHPTEVHVENWETLQAGEGAVLRLNNLQPKQFHLVSNRSQRILGWKTTLTSEGFPEPLTTFCGSTTVTPKDENAVIEFEDINFVGYNDASVSGFISCINGRNTTFRRCSFRNVQVIVTGNESDATVPWHSISDKRFENEFRYGSPNVTFENCLFDHGTLKEGLSGVLVCTNGTACLLNCFIRNCGHGVLVSEGGQASLTHCTISHCRSGIRAELKVKDLQIHNCLISDGSGCGIMLSQSKDATITGCRIQNCAYAGIVVKGLKHTSCIQIDSCHILNCYLGILFEMGKMTATVRFCTMMNNKTYGVAVMSSVMGSVEVNNCSTTHNTEGNVSSGNEGQCVVSVDGVEQEQGFDDEFRSKHLYARRCYQQAGIFDILCEHCGKKEEAGEKFKKCGKCEDVIYCSRECQKAHWKEHKKECKPTNACIAQAAAAKYDQGK